MKPPVRGRIELRGLCSRGKQTPKRSAVAASISVRLWGGQTRITSHQRRQISGDFHARANFDDDRGIPAHEFSSLSLSPRGPFLALEVKLTPFARRVTSFEVR